MKRKKSTCQRFGLGFDDLPPELQLNIFKQADISTLIHLVKVAVNTKVHGFALLELIGRHSSRAIAFSKSYILARLVRKQFFLLTMNVDTLELYLTRNMLDSEQVMLYRALIVINTFDRSMLNIESWRVYHSVVLGPQLLPRLRYPSDSSFPINASILQRDEMLKQNLRYLRYTGLLQDSLLSFVVDAVLNASVTNTAFESNLKADVNLTKLILVYGYLSQTQQQVLFEFLIENLASFKGLQPILGHVDNRHYMPPIFDFDLFSIEQKEQLSQVLLQLIVTDQAGPTVAYLGSHMACADPAFQAQWLEIVNRVSNLSNLGVILDCCKPARVFPENVRLWSRVVTDALDSEYLSIQARCRYIEHLASPRFDLLAEDVRAIVADILFSVVKTKEVQIKSVVIDAIAMLSYNHLSVQYKAVWWKLLYWRMKQESIDENDRYGLPDLRCLYLLNNINLDDTENKNLISLLTLLTENTQECELVLMEFLPDFNVSNFLQDTRIAILQMIIRIHAEGGRGVLASVGRLSLSVLKHLVLNFRAYQESSSELWQEYLQLLLLSAAECMARDGAHLRSIEYSAYVLELMFLSDEFYCSELVQERWHKLNAVCMNAISNNLINQKFVISPAMVRLLSSLVRKYNSDDVWMLVCSFYNSEKKERLNQHATYLLCSDFSRHQYELAIANLHCECLKNIAQQIYEYPELKVKEYFQVLHDSLGYGSAVVRETAYQVIINLDVSHLQAEYVHYRADMLNGDKSQIIPLMSYILYGAPSVSEYSMLLQNLPTLMPQMLMSEYGVLKCILGIFPALWHILEDKWEDSDELAQIRGKLGLTELHSSFSPSKT